MGELSSVIKISCFILFELLSFANFDFEIL